MKKRTKKRILVALAFVTVATGSGLAISSHFSSVSALAANPRNGRPGGHGGHPAGGFGITHNIGGRNG